MKNKNILVTGSHRSGSTFIGKMLALPKNVGYIGETFNTPVGVKGVDEKYPYFTKGSENEAKYNNIIKQILSGKAKFYRPKTEGNLIKRMGRLFFTSRSAMGYKKVMKNPAVERYLLKDPLACLSAEYFYREFDMDVVMIVRHPAAFVASIKRVEWDSHFDCFLKHKELIEGPLNFLPKEIENVDDFISRGALMWKCIYSVVYEMTQNTPEIIVVKHENLSLDPVGEFKQLYRKLNLSFNKEVEREVIRYTGVENPTDPVNNDVFTLKRNSRENVKRWKKVLAHEEINRIKSITKTIAARFYSEEEW